MGPLEAPPSSDEPPKTPSRLRLRLTGPAEAALRSGHPWIYAESIREQNRAGELGELGVIYDNRNRFLAIGLFDPDSPIRVRVLHAGKPRTLDNAWWEMLLHQALARREGLFGPETTGYRLINGESDGWPALVLDRYDQTLVLKLYSAAWLAHAPQLVERILQAVPANRLLLRLSRNIRDVARDSATLCRRFTDGMVLYGPPVKAEIPFQEHGIHFLADVLQGQKTGFFLDQRENRARVERLASGRDVLNAFSYSGGFSLYAARGGAHSVTNLDLSEQALESAARNVALNLSNGAIRKCRHEYVRADVFSWLRTAPANHYDLVIMDPPSLARRESQRADALQAYGRLARGGIDRLRRGGILVAASCSAHVSASEFFSRIRQTARQTGRIFRELASTGHPADHPASIPEAQYLKCIYLRLD